MHQSKKKIVKIFNNGRSKAIRIPKEFEFAGDEVMISRDGNCLVIEPVTKSGLNALLDQWQPLEPDDIFPDIDDDLPPLNDDDNAIAS